jgi:hypothetical protein
MSDSLLTPGWVIVSHPANQVSQILRPRRTAPLAGLHRQKVLKAVRCHLTKVSDLTIPSALRQSKNFASATGELFSREQILGDQSHSSRNE